MIKHIVMWRLKEEYNGESKSEIINNVKNILEDLTSKIQEIIELEVGVNFNPSEAAYDVVLYSSFNSREDLDIYQKHPDHLKVAEYISQVRTERTVVDYES